MRRIVLTYGLIAAGLLGGMLAPTMWLFDGFSLEYGQLIGYTTMVVAFLMIYFGVRSYRDNVAGGTVRFGRAVTVGSLIMLLGVVGYVATWEVIYYGFAPDFAETYAAAEIEKARAEGKSEAEVAALSAKMAEFAESYQNPLVNIAFTTLEPLPVGVVLTLVSAYALSRKREESAVGG